MIRHTVALCTTVMLTACEVERTPPEYFDHRDPVAVVRDEAVEELQARVLALGQALNRGSAAEALLALEPAHDAYLVSPEAETVLTGTEQISEALARLASDPAQVRTRDVQVTVGPRATVAWFRAELDRSGPAGDTPLRVTGVFVRGDGGAWRLVQAHLSPVTPPAAPPPSPDAAEDSLAAG